MKLIALILACFLWLIFIVFLKVHFKLFFTFCSYATNITIDAKILFTHFKVELNVPKEMVSSGSSNLLRTVLEDISKEECLSEGIKQAQEPRTSRYKAVKSYINEILKHYVSSWSKVVWIKRGLSRIKKFFYKKVNINSLNIKIEIGGRDAAETGLLVGVFWGFFGQMAARIYRLFTVKKNQICYHVIPRFDDEIFLCKGNCILSLKISHIIFTAYKFLLFILKNRRIRNYG